MGRDRILNKFSPIVYPYVYSFDQVTEDEGSPVSCEGKCQCLYLFTRLCFMSGAASTSRSCKSMAQLHRKRLENATEGLRAARLLGAKTEQPKGPAHACSALPSLRRHDRASALQHPFHVRLERVRFVAFTGQVLRKAQTQYCRYPRPKCQKSRPPDTKKSTESPLRTTRKRL